MKKILIMGLAFIDAMFFMACKQSPEQKGEKEAEALAQIALAQYDSMMLVEEKIKEINHNNFLNKLNKTVIIENLEIMSEDLGIMDWYSGKDACNDLGNGWRLPTPKELELLYENRDKIGGFADEEYFSSYETDRILAYAKDFHDGFNDNAREKDWTEHIRAVRISDNHSDQGFKIGDLLVMYKDLGIMNWEEAEYECNNLGEGWRLPNIEEIRLIFKNQEIIGGFSSELYWTSSAGEGGSYISAPDKKGKWIKIFGNIRGEAGEEWVMRMEKNCYVRAVRNLNFKNNDSIKTLNNANFSKLKIGDKFEDGIVFFLDKTGVHGLLADTVDIELPWAEAIKWCQSKGRGWHLPTLIELDKLYQKKRYINIFTTQTRWSSEPESGGAGPNGKARCFYFGDGESSTAFKEYTLLVRAVRVF